MVYLSNKRVEIDNYCGELLKEEFLLASMEFLLLTGR